MTTQSMLSENVGTKKPTLNENMKVLLQSVKLRSQQQTISFAASDIAVLTGYHPYGNILETFLKYLYQNLELLYELDLSTLQIEEISIEEEMKRILSKCSTDKQIEIQTLTNEIITQKDSLKNHYQVKDILQKSKDLLKTEKSKFTDEEYEFLQEELQYRIKTNYGKFNEEKALNLYEEITGFPVSERNQTCYVMEIPALMLDLTDLEEGDQPKVTRSEETNIPNNSTELQNNLEIKKSNIEIIDLCDTEEDTPIAATVSTKLKTSENFTLDTAEALSSLSEVSKKEKIFDYFQSKDLSSLNPPQPKKPSSPLEAPQTSSRRSKRQRKENSAIAFSIIGKVDGISYQMDAKGEDATQWKQYQIIIEMKNRVNRIFNPPPLYEQIQLTAYLLMTNSLYGDLVQVMPEEESLEIQRTESIKVEFTNHLSKAASTGDVSSSTTFRKSVTLSELALSQHNENISLLSKANSLPINLKSNPKNSSQVMKQNLSLEQLSYYSPTFSITRIAIDGPPYFHRYHWDTVILPRLHIIKDAIMTLRSDDDLRYSFLLSSDEEKLLLIQHLCPYLST
eukprot:gene6666-7181_t